MLKSMSEHSIESGKDEAAEQETGERAKMPIHRNSLLLWDAVKTASVLNRLVWLMSKVNADALAKSIITRGKSSLCTYS